MDTSLSPFGVYIHVPFCTVRCGYCDFNTYTKGFGIGAEPASYARSVIAEMHMAAQYSPPPATTVYLGGGTPSLLPVDQIQELLDGVRNIIGIRPGAEVSMEANPDTVTPDRVAAWREAGVTRISMGMQSGVGHVLRILERTHRPEHVRPAVDAVRDAGLDISLDLIYGTPGESLHDWRQSVQAVLDMHPHHISAYGLVVEEGTKMGRQVRRGELPSPSDDDEARKYQIADELFSDAGYSWYEISNWAYREADEGEVVATHLRHVSRHNLAYWRDEEWWGFGPGSHSHMAGERWWNVKHPRVYAHKVLSGESPRMDGEHPTEEEHVLERIMLGIRLAEGLDIHEIPDHDTPARAHTIDDLVQRGFIIPEALAHGRLILTRHGRLLADAVTRDLAFS